MRIAAAVVAVGLVTCSETVRLNDKAREVEFVGHEYSGKQGKKCHEVGQITVNSIPAEVSGEDNLSVLEVKMMNQARKMGATHLLRWPSREWACDKNGTENPESERRCGEMGATALVCLIGRGT